MKRLRASLGLSLLLVVLALLATACIWSDEDVPASKSAGASVADPVALAKEYRISIATGGISGSYYPYGSAVAGLWANNLKGVTVTAETTSGSVENLHLLNSRRAELALVQNDLADNAYEGVGAFKAKNQSLRAIASLFPELVQWAVVPSIRSLADLKGKKIAVGPVDSGSEANTRQILEANGLTYEELGKALFLSESEAADVFRDGQIDGFFITGGVPSPAIAEASAQRPIAIMPITGEEARRVMDGHSFFAPARIPAGTYNGVNADVPTISVQAMLVAREDLDEELVYWLARTLLEQQPDLAQAHPEGRRLSREGAVSGLTVPLHPGAERYYREIGVLR